MHIKPLQALIGCAPWLVLTLLCGVLLSDINRSPAHALFVADAFLLSHGQIKELSPSSPVLNSAYAEPRDIDLSNQSTTIAMSSTFNRPLNLEAINYLLFYAISPISPISSMQASTDDERLLNHLTANALNAQSLYWLEVSARFGNVSALFQQAIKTESVQKQQQLLKKAAELGHAQSQFELSLLDSIAGKSLYWLKQSAQSNYEPAIISLGKYYFDNSQYEDAKTWLIRAAEFDGLSAFKLGKLHWKRQNRQSALAAFKQAFVLGHKHSEQYLAVLNHHTEFSINEWLATDDFIQLPPLTPTSNEECAQTIVLLANSLSSMVQARQYHQRFMADARLQSLSICMQSPKWIERGDLNCSILPKTNGRLSCNLYPIAKKRKVPVFSHLVVFADRGKANVNNGVMYIDRADEYSVFIHELAHFAGFVDEYALPKKLAQYHCNTQTAPNLVTLINDLFVPQDRAKEWQEALSAFNTQDDIEKPYEIGLSKTCKNIERKSYKPSNQLTFMEYHDTAFIPPIYSLLWQQSIVQSRSQQPFITNLSLAALDNDDVELSAFWDGLQNTNEALPLIDE